MNKLVSVIISVYNTPVNYLSEAVDSVLRQTYSNLEIIIINDGSESYVDDYLSSIADTRVKLIKNSSNFGVVKSRNLGLAASAGSFIAIFDSDDVMSPLRIEKQVSYILSNKSLSFVGSFFKTIDITGKTIANHKLPIKQNQIDLRIAFKGDPSIGHPFSMFRRNVLIENQYSVDCTVPGSEDYELFLRLRSQGYNYENVPVPLTSYRIHSAQVTSNPSSYIELNRRTFRNFVSSVCNPIEQGCSIHCDNKVSFYERFKTYRTLRQIKIINF